MGDAITFQNTLDSMVKKGWRITEQRRRLAELFAKTEGYLSPKDVYEYLREDSSGCQF